MWATLYRLFLLAWNLVTGTLAGTWIIGYWGLRAGRDVVDDPWIAAFRALLWGVLWLLSLNQIIEETERGLWR